MNYYKIEKDSKFIGVGASYDLRRYQRKHNVIMACNEDLAEYIQVGDELYHDSWMILPDNNVIRYITATVIQITKEEFDALNSAKSVEELTTPEEPTPTVEEPTEPDEYIEYIRSMKIKEISMACNGAIISGFDHDGRHYSLSIEDQIELQSLAFEAKEDGDATFLYHADSYPYEEFTSEQILALYNTANEFKNYHRMYFNRLKQYVMGLSTMQEINSVYYGMKIPE